MDLAVVSSGYVGTTVAALGVQIEGEDWRLLLYARCSCPDTNSSATH
ncbi:hypothetical protein [Halalkalicoccus jeotgali]|uniref:Uncharacterized protein n=2 Tax=Halalkalicoccus jeotgali TaxID=413810 RepID=D8J7H8_HALJB|nr:hypothetical protein [Halalkalicoccus jeotgali]ADJ14073.1 hypothetical protein HacjB3_03410 [Halalkalicoccus jeotgali B3]ELY33883.1 hypothetical protein C497_15897 [Halalkalicoccus jeotgali B3]